MRQYQHGGGAAPLGPPRGDSPPPARQERQSYVIEHISPARKPAAAVQPPAPPQVETGSAVPEEHAALIQARQVRIPTADPQTAAVVTRLVTGRPLVPTPEPGDAAAALLSGPSDIAARTPVAA